MFGKYWQKLLAASLIVGNLFLMPIVNAEVKLYTATSEDYASEIESQEVAKLRARDKAIRNATEQAGVYLKTYSRTVNFNLTDDEITAIASNSYELVGEVQYSRVVKQITDETSVIVWCATVNVNVDDAEIRNWTKRDAENRSKFISQTRDTNAVADENERKVTDLRKRAETASDAERAKLKSEFDAADNEFLYNQKIEEGTRASYKHDFEEAAKLFGEAVEINPDNPKAYTSRGNIYAVNISVMKYKFEDSPGVRWVRSHGNSAETYYNLALADLSKAIELAPNDPKNYTMRGYAHYNFEKYPQALADWDKALQIDPAYLTTYLYRYLYYSSVLKDNKLALADINRAIELNPDKPGGYSMRSLNYKQSKQYDLALADINKAIEFDPNKGHHYYFRGDIYLELKDYNRAVEDFNRCLELDPNFYTVYHGFVNAHKALGQYDLAAEDYTQIIKNSSDKGAATWYYNRGDCYQKLKMYDKAIADFTKAISIMSLEENPNIFFRLSYQKRAECYKSLGDTAKAQADFAKADELNRK